MWQSQLMIFVFMKILYENGNKEGKNNFGVGYDEVNEGMDPDGTGVKSQHVRPHNSDGSVDGVRVNVRVLGASSVEEIEDLFDDEVGENDSFSEFQWLLDTEDEEIREIFQKFKEDKRRRIGQLDEIPNKIPFDKLVHEVRNGG